MTKFFVKFVPWNSNTITSLLKKKVWFSRTYDFNDPYEYPVVNACIHEKYKDKITADELSKYFSDPYAIYRLIDCLLKKYAYCQNNKEYNLQKEWLDQVVRLLTDKKYKDLIAGGAKYAGILDHILYYQTGIFSMSSINVFDDDAAILMFAHYAEKLTGLALIFTIDKTKSVEKITYAAQKPGNEKEVGLYCFKDALYIEPFLYKSLKWSYEEEYRLFGVPGLNNMDELGLKLSGIFYTDKFLDIESLEIIRNVYGDIFIQDIYASSDSLSKYQFITNKQSIVAFLQNTESSFKTITRTSQLSDIDAMVSLSKAKRMLYEEAQPQFWRYAGEEGDNAQRQWFKELLDDENYLMFIAESDAKEIVGFIIGKLTPAPEVYNPGGLTLMIDDFCVNCENLWQSVGASLIEETKAAAKAKGATQILVVCGVHDLPKRKFLSEQNLSIASEWFVGGIV